MPHTRLFLFFFTVFMSGCAGYTLVDRHTIALNKSDSVLVTRIVRRSIAVPFPHSAWFFIGEDKAPCWSWKWRGSDYNRCENNTPVILNHDSQDFYAVISAGETFQAQRFRDSGWQDVPPAEFPADIALFNLWSPHPSRDPWYPWLTQADGNQRAFLHWLRAAQPNLPSDSNFCLERLKDRWNLLCPQEEEALAKREGWEHTPSVRYLLPDSSELRLFEDLGLTPACQSAAPIKGASDACTVVERMHWRGDSLMLLEVGYPTDVLLVRLDPKGPHVVQKIEKHTISAPCRLRAAVNPDSSRLVLSLYDHRSEGITMRWEYVAPLRPASR